MGLNNNQKQIVDKLISKAREKKYKEATIELLIMLCCSKNMHEHFGTTEEAMNKTIEFLDTGMKSSLCLTKLFEMSGYKED